MEPDKCVPDGQVGAKAYQVNEVLETYLDTPVSFEDFLGYVSLFQSAWDN